MNLDSVLDYVEDQKRAALKTVGEIMDITLYSEGALSYRELMGMNPTELKVAVDRLNKYMKDRADAMKKASQN